MQNVPYYSKGDLEKDLVLLGKQARASQSRVLFSVVEAKTFQWDNDPHDVIEQYRAEGLEDLSA